jgi:MFS family permease
VRRWLSDTVGGLPRTFWMLFSAMLINRVGAFGLLLLPTYLTTMRGTDLATAGLVTGLYGAGGAIGTLSGGVLADRWGRKTTYLVGTSCAAVLMLGLGFAGPLWLIAVLAALIGVTHTMPGPAIVAAVVDVLPEQDRYRAFNLQFWAFNMGGAVAAALAGVIAEQSFLALFMIDAAMTGLTALLVWRLVPETRPAGVGKKPADRLPSAGGLATAFSDRIFLIFVGLTFVLAILTVQGTSMLQLSMEADGLRPSAYGLVVSLGGALIVVGQLFVPKLIGRRRHATVLALAFGLVGIGYAVVSVADVLGVYVAAAVVWTVGQMLAAPPNASIMAELSPPGLRGRYQGVFYLVFPAAGFVAPAVGGWSLQHLGSWHWVLCGVLGLLAAAGHLRAAGSRERRVAAVASQTAASALEPAL